MKQIKKVCGYCDNPLVNGVCSEVGCWYRGMKQVEEIKEVV